MSYNEQLTGETQLRARRTRIKILRAIVDRNGVAGFSDIKVSTGLSTGSIYYHLERMRSYVTKDSKHYMITEEGMQFLRESDPKYSGVAPPRREEQARTDSGRPEETARQARFGGARQYALTGMIVAIIAFAVIGALASWQGLAAFASMNAGVAASAALAAALLASFVMLGRHSFPIIGYRGTIVSILALGLLASVLAFSSLQFAVAPAQSYDNSMDALLSSYSMHWQIR
jgi:predicted transcriptional regulator